MLTVSHTSTEYTTGASDGGVIQNEKHQANITSQMMTYSSCLHVLCCCKEKEAPRNKWNPAKLNNYV